jgi:CO/xanthine dehydrogenase FAD-binding subunit/aerobic-type carbon monoxide dehydrogenase small subunit (CoxS/CutS family)
VKPAPFAYIRARSLAEALDVLGADPEARLLAGGQSLVPMLNMRLVRPSRLVDLNAVPGLDGIHATPGGGLAIGALVRHAELVSSPSVGARAPLLAAAAAHVGHRAIRNRGTIGGSLAHADPAAELPAAVVALEAHLVAASPRGHRRIAAADFFTGLFATALAPDEILVAVEVPPSATPAWGFAEVARRAGDFALAGVAGVVIADRDRRCVAARLVAFGAGDRPQRLAAAEAALVKSGGAGAGIAAIAAGACAPTADVHASAEYRRHLVGVLAEQVVRDAIGRLSPGRAARVAAPGAAVEAARNAAAAPPPAGPGERAGTPGSGPGRAGEGADAGSLHVRLSVNGRAIDRPVSPRRSLADFLREDLRLTGTHVGCEHGVCGACTVLLDGRTARSCLLLAAQLEGARVTTIEGLTPEHGLSPIQEAFREAHGLQCGFCTPAMILTAHELLGHDPAPARASIREAIGGNLCMCTGYVNIVRAIELAASRIRNGASVGTTRAAASAAPPASDR